MFTRAYAVPELPHHSEFLHATRRDQAINSRTALDESVLHGCNLAKHIHQRAGGVPVWNILGDGPLTSPEYSLVDLLDEGILAWQDRALCAQTDPEAFFPEKGGSTREAKRVCNSCEVRTECLEYALENDERFGIWGGLSERERRKLKRRAI